MLARHACLQFLNVDLEYYFHATQGCGKSRMVKHITKSFRVGGEAKRGLEENSF